MAADCRSISALHAAFPIPSPLVCKCIAYLCLGTPHRCSYSCHTPAKTALSCVSVHFWAPRHRIEDSMAGDCHCIPALHVACPHVQPIYIFEHVRLVTKHIRPAFADILNIAAGKSCFRECVSWEKCNVILWDIFNAPDFDRMNRETEWTGHVSTFSRMAQLRALCLCTLTFIAKKSCRRVYKLRVFLANQVFEWKCSNVCGRTIIWAANAGASSFLCSSLVLHQVCKKEWKHSPQFWRVLWYSLSWLRVNADLKTFLFLPTVCGC